MTNSNTSCEALDAALPDFLEGTLDDSRRSSVERHLRECVRCMSLVRDIESIRKEAQALPDLVPARDLWEGIEARIAAPVIALAARPEQSKRFVPAWMGIAAAALVVSTAGVTYLLTARSLAPASVAIVAGNGARSSLTPVMATGPSAPDQQAAPIARGSEQGGRVGVAPTSGGALRVVGGEHEWREPASCCNQCSLRKPECGPSGQQYRSDIRERDLSAAVDCEKAKD